MKIPLFLSEQVFSLPFMKRPYYLAKTIPDSPLDEEVLPNYIFIEIRGGNLKWLHLKCPKCGEHIQLPAVGEDRWKLKTDWLGRPTLSPSIWEIRSCGAHFIIRRGEIFHCQD